MRLRQPHLVQAHDLGAVRQQVARAARASAAGVEGGDQHGARAARGSSVSGRAASPARIAPTWLHVLDVDTAPAAGRGRIESEQRRGDAVGVEQRDRPGDRSRA